jgi:integrase
LLFCQQTCLFFATFAIFKARLNPPLPAGAERRAAMTKLTSKKIEALRRAGHQGRVLNGDGLMLQCRGKGKDGQGRASWLLRYTVKGRVKELGLGSIKDVSLAQARQKAAAARLSINEGKDPIDAKRPQRSMVLIASPTFGQAVNSFYNSNLSRWRNSKVRNGWPRFMATHAALLWEQPVSNIDHHIMLQAIEPLWGPHLETAHKLMNRIAQVLDFSRVKGWRTGETPRMKGTFEHVLPKAANINQHHHHALPLTELPPLMRLLEALPGVAALAFRFTILTASQVGEVFGATWAEIDIDAKIWRIPAIRYKTQKEHLVALSSHTMQVLASCPRFTDNPYVFPCPTKAGARLSNMAIITLLKRMGIKTTAHGTARSTFSDWAHDFVDVSHEVIEECLGHQTGNAVSRAYRRGQALEKRRALLEASSSDL